MHRSALRIAIYAIIVASFIAFLSGVTSAATSVTIVPSTETVEPGEEFTLDILVKPDTPVSGLQLDLSYDSSLVTINDVEEGDFFASDGSAVMFNPGTIDESDGTVSQIYGAIIMGDGVTGEGVFCTLNLVAEYNEGPCQFRMTDLIIGDEQGKELPATTVDSTISITGAVGLEEKTNDKNNDETELNIVPAQNEESTFPDSEQDAYGNENEEQVFASTPEQAEGNSADGVAVPEAQKNRLSGVLTLIFAAIAFFGLAYVLDRKK